MIIPIGHDKGFYRRPWLTGGIIALCTIVYIVSLWFMPEHQDVMDLERENRELVGELWRAHGEQWVARSRPDLQSWPKQKLRFVPQSYRAIFLDFLSDFAAGKVVADNHESYHTWRSFQQKERRKLGALRYAYRAGDASVTLVTYAFLHGGVLHLAGNMFFLLLCGCCLEDRWGRGLWGLLYLAGAAASALSYGWYHDWNPHYAAVGASGAVSAAMGAFLITNHDARIRLFYLLFWGFRFIFGTFTMRAYVALPLWLLNQIAMISFESMLQVGYSAHIGGFVFGMGFALLLKAIGTDKKLAGKSEQEATICLQPQPYLDGVAFREQGEVGLARQCFERLLSEQPDHVAAALELTQMAIRDGDAAAAAAAAPRAVRNLKRIGDKATIGQLWLELNRLDAGIRLDDRTLLSIAQSQVEADPREALGPYLALAEQHPQSNLRPKALLEAAQLYMELHDRNETRKTLDEVISAYPNTAFAERAEALLREYGLQSPPVVAT